MILVRRKFHGRRPSKRRRQARRQRPGQGYAGFQNASSAVAKFAHSACEPVANGAADTRGIRSPDNARIDQTYDAAIAVAADQSPSRLNDARHRRLFVREHATERLAEQPRHFVAFERRRRQADADDDDADQRVIGQIDRFGEDAAEDREADDRLSLRDRRNASMKRARAASDMPRVWRTMRSYADARSHRRRRPGRDIRTTATRSR